ncbi:MAG: hypothetical protein ABIY55_12445, partial [Kofleriaceae bacterium]
MRIAGFTALALAASGAAHAQAVERRYVEAPTGGMALPATPLAGEHDARAVTVNPGGLALIRGRELAVALDVDDSEIATSAGQGLGAFWAQSIGGRFVPRFGLGLAVEWLRPPTGQLALAPERAFRATLALAAPLGRTAGAGIAWHHLRSDGALDGVDTIDLGLSLRFGGHAAVGAVVRDLATRDLAGAPVQRRYEAEL